MRKETDWTPFASLQGYVRLVLLVEWDPIGIFGYSGAMTEYDSYAAEICAFLRAEVSREKLIAHLDKIEKQEMGLRGERPAQSLVADKLLSLYRIIRQIEEHWPEEGST